MKNLLLLNYEFPPLGGGASPVSYEIAKRLSETGKYYIDVVTMGGYDGLPTKEKINQNLIIHRVKCIRRKKQTSQPHEQLTYLISAFFKVKQLIKKKQYHLCHCHFVIPTGVLAYLLKKKYGLEYVITSHGSDIPGFNPDRFNFLHRFTRPFIKKIILQANKTITPSEYLKKLILKNVDSNLGHKLNHIPNGIDTINFRPLQKKKIILSSGRMIRRKGFQHLIKAYSQLNNQDYQLHICGDGPYLNYLKKFAKKLDSNIIFHGWLDNKSPEYQQLLAETSIYCLLSNRENASVSLLEALASGCAIVTSHAAGCVETIGSAGIKVSPKKHAQITRELNELIADSRKREKYQKLARKRAENFFSWNFVIEEYSKVLS